MNRVQLMESVFGALKADADAYGPECLLLLRSGGIAPVLLASPTEPAYLKALAESAPSQWLAYRSTGADPVFNMPLLQQHALTERKAYEDWIKRSVTMLNARFRGGDVGGIETDAIDRVTRFVKRGKAGEFFTLKEMGVEGETPELQASACLLVSHILDPLRVKVGRPVEVVRGHGPHENPVLQANEDETGLSTGHAGAFAADVRVRGMASVKLASAILSTSSLTPSLVVYTHPDAGAYVHVEYEPGKPMRVGKLSIHDGAVLIEELTVAEALKEGDASVAASTVAVKGIDVPPIRNEDRQKAIKDGRLSVIQLPTAKGPVGVAWAAKHRKALDAVAERLALPLKVLGITEARYPALSRDLLIDYGANVDWDGLASQLVRTFDGSHNYRATRSNPNRLSQHSYATAIDINASKNPMVKRPWTTKGYQQALWDAVFRPAGFSGWGGLWTSSADDMHFGIFNA